MNKLTLILASTALAAIMTVGASNADARSRWSVGVNTGPGYGYCAPNYYYGPTYYQRPVYRPNYYTPTYSYGPSYYSPGYYGGGYYAPQPSFSFSYSKR